jgi:hypothetical protein
MKRQVLMKTVVLVSLLALPLTYQACSPALQQSPSGMEINGGGTTTDNPKPTIDVSVVNSAGTVSGNVQLCLDEIYFSGTNTSSQSASLAGSPSASNQYARSFYPSPSTYMPTAGMGASYYASAQVLQDLMQYTQSLWGMTFMMGAPSSFLKTIPIVPAAYTDVDLRLGQSCSFGSLSMMTPSGRIDVDEPLTLHFSGAGHLLTSGELSLDATEIMSALSTARNAAEIKATLSSVAGRF